LFGIKTVQDGQLVVDKGFIGLPIAY